MTPSSSAEDTQRPVGVSRRGVLAGTAATGAALTIEAAPAHAARPLRVAVLLTAGVGDGRAGQRLLAGLRIGFARAGQPVTLRSRTVHSPSAAHAEAVKVLDGGADVLVAAISGLALPRVAQLCAERKVALVVANSGAHVNDLSLTGVVVNSLQIWQSAFAMGRFAARRLGGSVFTITAAPDAGYDSVYALQRGFTGAGGRVVGRAVTHQATKGLVEAARQARRSGAAVVSVHATKQRAVEIVKACRAAGFQGSIVVDPLSLELGAAGRAELARAGAWTTSAWAYDQGNSHARDLARRWKRQVGGRPDAWALLGHDTALLVAEGARRVRRRGGGLRTLPAKLRHAKVAGARGLQVVNGATGVVSTPLVVRRARPKDLSGARVMARPARVPGDAPAMVVQGRGDKSGYVDEYTTT
ncbi:ABC transporter substrate-binding protein [Nocardioides daphniae]|uniref:Leucine-binding protein domain-containing protein n=1 Tax=Nocardioides daphniae TaxID=402297 RepID=A0A4P7UD63_9ACTN|nr:ABC transporter substrate-binding protein [Nocardioides daphniae]QCC76859.1 hypothetical protein E2C04_05825 [Nocardioides daphniae]GGD17144.1 hypothetical protein GCM10007231_15140 [Nocardioides daphniae]